MEFNPETIIANTAFPIAVAWYLLSKFSKLLETLNISVENNTKAIEKLLQDQVKKGE